MVDCMTVFRMLLRPEDGEVFQEEAKMDSPEMGCVSVFVCLGLFALGCSCGGCVMERHMERKAVDAGVAEFVIVDPLDGRTEFRW